MNLTSVDVSYTTNTVCRQPAAHKLMEFSSCKSSVTFINKLAVLPNRAEHSQTAWAGRCPQGRARRCRARRRSGDTVNGAGRSPGSGAISAGGCQGDAAPAWPRYREGRPGCLLRSAAMFIYLCKKVLLGRRGAAEGRLLSGRGSCPGESWGSGARSPRGLEGTLGALPPPAAAARRPDPVRHSGTWCGTPGHGAALPESCHPLSRRFPRPGLGLLRCPAAPAAPQCFPRQALDAAFPLETESLCTVWPLAPVFVAQHTFAAVLLLLFTA